MNGMLVDSSVMKIFGFKDLKTFHQKLVDWGAFYWSNGRIYPEREFGLMAPIEFEYRSHRRVIWFAPWAVDFVEHCKIITENKLVDHE